METKLLTNIGYPVSGIEDLKIYAPAAFADTKSPKVSDRYSFVSTRELIESFLKLGWQLTHVRQHGSNDYARHVIRFVHPDLGFLDIKSDKVRPQIILDNSHNGVSNAQIFLGLFRLICTNGLVVSMPGMFTAVKLRHIGIKTEELKKILEVISDQYKNIGVHVSEMQNIILNQSQKEELAINAIAIREPHVFIKDDGSIDMVKATKIVNPAQIVKPIREEDNRNDLWTIFNIIQERLVKGEFDRQTLSGRRTKPRGINNAARNIDFNIKLWQTAENLFFNVK